MQTHNYELGLTALLHQIAWCQDGLQLTFHTSCHSIAARVEVQYDSTRNVASTVVDYSLHSAKWNNGHITSNFIHNKLPENGPHSLFILSRATSQGERVIIKCVPKCVPGGGGINLLHTRDFNLNLPFSTWHLGLGLFDP